GGDVDECLHRIRIVTSIDQPAAAELRDACGARVVAPGDRHLQQGVARAQEQDGRTAEVVSAFERDVDRLVLERVPAGGGHPGGDRVDDLRVVEVGSVGRGG